MLGYKTFIIYNRNQTLKFFLDHYVFPMSNDYFVYSKDLIKKQLRRNSKYQKKTLKATITLMNTFANILASKMKG